MIVESVESVESVEYVQNYRWTHLDVGPTPMGAGLRSSRGDASGVPRIAERSPCICHTCNGCFLKGRSKFSARFFFVE